MTAPTVLRSGDEPADLTAAPADLTAAPAELADPAIPAVALADPAAHVADPATPAVDLGAPAGGLAAPVADLAAPAVDLAASGGGLAAPVADLAPVVDLTGPVVDLTGPVVGLVAPADLISAPAGLVVLARSSWPAGHADQLPAVAAFVRSSFSPLAAALAEECLTSYFGPPPAEAWRGDQIAIVLASATGDMSTAAAIAMAVDAGVRVPPLLFFQSNANSAAGYIAARWALAGPVVCTIPAGDAMVDAIECAGLLIEDGAAQAALVIVADAGHTGDASGSALLLGPAHWRPVRSAADPAGPAGAPADTGAPAEPMPIRESDHDDR
jgi:hypothetical protein